MADAGAERLGVLGGTFDPVHVGHLVAAVTVRHALALDRVLLMVANLPWQKAGRRLTPPEDRLGAVEAAIEGVDGLEASRLEIDRGGETSTADTLEELASRRPSPELFLIVGADVAAELGTWRRVDVVRRAATVVVVTRPGATPPALGDEWRATTVEIPRLEVSSSDLRARVAAGWPIDYLTPPGVVRLIRQRGLYAGGR